MRCASRASNGRHHLGLCALQAAPRDLRGTLSALCLGTSVLGIGLGSAASGLIRETMTDSQIMSYGWRIPFWFGGVVAVLVSRQNATPHLPRHLEPPVSPTLILKPPVSPTLIRPDSVSPPVRAAEHGRWNHAIVWTIIQHDGPNHLGMCLINLSCGQVHCLKGASHETLEDGPKPPPDYWCGTPQHGQ